ncbi:hypothetical protein KUTeg_015123 [Tegillarca granosa]|uniref:Gamma-glutamylcyclotransferase family protein n=1 Tax=Tegillarca granosa TaxID=220873 RepID=A0ABQ9EP76_TEGGR|nr:hypothetical protein KUTeg_015123 [Tegillarca granosa]
MMNKVFVYGTLKSNQPNGRFMRDNSNGFAKFIGKGVTEKRYPLVIIGEFNLPGLLKKEDLGKQVLGEIFEVDEKKTQWLDMFEDHPHLYKREIIRVIQVDSGDSGDQAISQRVQECWCYFYQQFEDSQIKPPFYDDYNSSGARGLEYNQE